MNKTKIVIIGATGTAFKRTIPALKDSQTCEVVAVQGRNTKKLQKIESSFGINKIYSNVNEMLLNENYDCIYIGTPPFLHYENLKVASLTLKPIICEKPLAVNYTEAKKIKSLLRDYNDKTFMVAHHLRHQQAILDIKKIIEDGDIGEVLNVSMQWGFKMNLNAPSSIWKTDPNKGGSGTFSDNGIHIVDLIVFLFGIPKSVFGKVEMLRTKKTYDNETALLMYDKLCVHLQSSQSMEFPGNNILIYGTEGNIEIYNGIGEQSIRRVSIKSKDLDTVREYPDGNLYKNEVENFCNSISNSNYKNHGCNLEDGIISLKIIDLIRESAEVNLPLNFDNE